MGASRNWITAYATNVDDMEVRILSPSPSDIQTKKCVRCGLEKPVKKFVTRTGVNGLSVDSKCLLCRDQIYHARLRLEMLNAFGRKCSCCGEEHPFLLTLEHVLGRDKGRPLNTYREILRAKRSGWDRSKYQCLCMSCNFAKGKYGQCPHRSGVTKEEAYKIIEQAAVGVGCSRRNPQGYGRFKTGLDVRRFREKLNP